MVPGITDSESENDAENERNNNATERTPLLGNSSNQQSANENLVYSNTFIERRFRRVRDALSNNVPSTSNNIVNNSTNDLVINVQVPTVNEQSSLRSSRSSNRRSANRRSRLQINAEINSPQSTINTDQPTTSNSNVPIFIGDDDEDEQRSTRSNVSTLTYKTANLSMNNQTMINTSTQNLSDASSSNNPSIDSNANTIIINSTNQQSSNGNRNNSTMNRSYKRQDNIV